MLIKIYKIRVSNRKVFQVNLESSNYFRRWVYKQKRKKLKRNDYS